MTIFKSIAMMMLLAFSASSIAEQKTTLGNWEVHYMVVNSTFLTPQVANAYGIKRSGYNAMVNISVLDKTSKKAQSVAMMGAARNLLGTQKKLEFKEVNEGEAIYYLAELPFRDQEQYRFEISIVSGNEKQTLKFEEKLFTE
jgi:hypothetical protein